MKEYEYYFFDLFHTLVKIEPYEIPGKREYVQLGITEKEWGSYAEYDYENRATGKQTDPDRILESIIRRIDREISAETIAEIIDVRKSRFRKALTGIRKPILDTIAELDRRGKKLVLVSNADAFDKLYWKDSPLFPFFGESVFSCDVGCMKPCEEIYRIAIQRVGADISRSAFIGDGGHNELCGAKKAGLDTVLTTEIIGELWPDAIGRLARDADFVIESLTELLSW